MTFPHLPRKLVEEGEEKRCLNSWDISQRRFQTLQRISFQTYYAKFYSVSQGPKK